MAHTHIAMGKPRPGEGVPPKDFKKPGAHMAVLGLCPGSDASAALVTWTNPSGRFPALDPASMDIRLLAKLPSDALPDGTHRRLDIPAAREALHAALATLPPGCQTYAYLLDSSQGAEYAGDPGVAAIVAANLERASQALLGLPLAHTGRVSSNARSRSLKIGKNKKSKAAIQTAVAVFPQVEGRIKVAKHDWPLAGALLVVAHVIGATARPIPALPAAATAAAAGAQSAAAAAGAAAAARAAGGAQSAAAAAGAAAAAARAQSAAAAAGAAAAARAAAGVQSAAAATGAAAAARAAAAAAAAGSRVAPQVTVKQEPHEQGPAPGQAAAAAAAAVATAAAAGNWAAPQVALKPEPHEQAAAAGQAAGTPVVVTPSQRPKRPMRGAGAGGRSRKRAAAAGDFGFAGDD